MMTAFAIFGMVCAAFLLLEAVLWAPQVWGHYQFKRDVKRGKFRPWERH